MRRLRIVVALALAVSVPSCMTAAVALGVTADSKAIVGLGIPLGLIADSFVVSPLDSEVDHDTAWITLMFVDLLVTAVIYKVAYHGHQVL